MTRKELGFLILSIVFSSCLALNLIPKDIGALNALELRYTEAIRNGRVPLTKELSSKNPNIVRIFTYATALENYDLDELTSYFDRNIPGVGFNRLTSVLRALPSNQKLIKYLHRNEKDPVVQIESGWLRGTRVRPEKYRHFDAFLGIPYASKPERFELIKPARPWQGFKKAQTEQYACLQYLPEVRDLIGSEDCLYANVMTPSIKKKNLPVIVWVHGGLFKLGFGNSFYYGPDFIMMEDVVLVMFNYRLGVFGFMSMGDHHIPGNLGMKDIVFFLKWIQRNIRSFGGDPDNVTLFGISTGAAAIQLLTISPTARGLYHKIAADSASIEHAWAYTKDPTIEAYRLAKNLDIDTSDRSAMVEALRKMDARLMVRAGEKIFRDQYPTDDYLAFLPCAENYVRPGDEAFMTEYPAAILDSGNYTKVPMMLGFMSGEGLFWMTTPRSFEYRDHMIEYLIPPDLMGRLKTNREKQAVLQAIRNFYFGGREVNRDNEQNYVDFLSDTKIHHRMHQYVQRLVRESDVPIWYYEFAYDAYLGQTRIFGNLTLKGVAHADDCGYYFRLIFGDPNEGDVVTEMVIKRMTHMLANFAKFGHPTPFLTELTPIRWDPISSPHNLEYMRITKDMKMKKKPHQNRFEFWNWLYNEFGR